MKKAMDVKCVKAVMAKAQSDAKAERGDGATTAAQIVQIAPSGPKPVTPSPVKRAPLARVVEMVSEPSALRASAERHCRRKVFKADLASLRL